MTTTPKLILVVFSAAVAFGQENASLNSSDHTSKPAWTAELGATAEERMLSAPTAEIAKPEAVIATATSITIPLNAPTQTPQRQMVSERERKIWYSLLVTEHSAAFFDAWSTRQVLSTGGRELDPLVRPFAHSATLYPALQVAPLGMDYLGAKLMHSQNRALRRLWWVPQAAAATGSLLCGAMNLPNRR